MLKKILIGLTVVIAVFLIVVATRPNEFKLSRSTVINASPTEVFPQVNNFHNWKKWSPWAKLDPDMGFSFEGPDSGVGAVYDWYGNKQVGAGRITLTENRPPELVVLRLDFLKPRESVSKTEFTFVPEGAGTAVTWTMSGEMDFISKAVCMFMSMEKTMGPYFEKGLAQMKAEVEKRKEAGHDLHRRRST